MASDRALEERGADGDALEGDATEAGDAAAEGEGVAAAGDADEAEAGAAVDTALGGGVRCIASGEKKRTKKSEQSANNFESKIRNNLYD